jgi:hypothetical protein
MSTPNPNRNIYQRLHAVMREVEYIKKDTKVAEGGGYMAVTHDNVTAHVRPHFLANGIAMSVSLISSELNPTGTQTSKGTPIVRYEGVYDVTFTNIDDPKDQVVERVEGHANDSGDKAPGKAMSYATKYAILKVLMIETGVDDEGRMPQDEPPDFTAAYLEKIKNALTVTELQKIWSGYVADSKKPENAGTRTTETDKIIKEAASKKKQALSESASAVAA